MKHLKMNEEFLSTLEKWAGHYGVAFGESELKVINSAVQDFIFVTRLELKAGDLIMKRNREQFKVDGTKTFSVVIETITRTNSLRTIIINRTINMNVDDVVVVTKEEVEKYEELWEKCGVIHTIRNHGEFTHVREDTGKPKVDVPKHRAQTILYSMNVKQPESKLEAYVCNVCGEIHIGKSAHLV
jgi:hypothetical protein